MNYKKKTLKKIVNLHSREQVQRKKQTIAVDDVLTFEAQKQRFGLVENVSQKNLFYHTRDYLT